MAVFLRNHSRDYAKVGSVRLNENLIRPFFDKSNHKTRDFIFSSKLNLIMAKYTVELDEDEECIVEFFVKTSGFGSVNSWLKHVMTNGNEYVQDLVSQMLEDYHRRKNEFCKEIGVTIEEVERIKRSINKLKKEHPERYLPVKLDTS